MGSAPVLFLFVLLVAGSGQAGKYSREANEAPRAPAPAQFRVVKLNQIWEKAQRLQLSAVKLAELHSDLKIQEKDELGWKKLKAEGLDEDGEKEAKLRHSLHVIMAKYGMNGKKDAQIADSNYIKDGSESDVLDDPRLEKLWSKAKTSGKFSEDELDKLWREFKHHKEKIYDYNLLLETVSRTEEIHKNVINPSEENVVKEELLHSKHRELKDKLRSINQGFERLRKVSHQGYDTTSGSTVKIGSYSLQFSASLYQGREGQAENEPNRLDHSCTEPLGIDSLLAAYNLSALHLL
ncbi:PREDICTED: alpha-2-macroglobulin receptor-associated protein isoform X2 [Gavialis gangeticus]|uniref:alpha-2-macroglobulin receptor-associated protein isoform X2 n=1 Tax=Gavialis gangeticus TaxID=94835 RepID=UPI00092F6A01|nr:PREDICTED: alpha-2-macroglobulin receptor-associated protein isoform X2 [Gavialis gangeticus]